MGLYGMILCIPNGILAERELLSHDGSFFLASVQEVIKPGVCLKQAEDGPNPDNMFPYANIMLNFRNDYTILC